MSNRANSTNSTGTGTTQTQAGNVATAQTWVTTFPKPVAITVTKVLANMSGASVGDAVERDSDGALWDTTAGCNVPPDCTTLSSGNDMAA